MIKAICLAGFAVAGFAGTGLAATTQNLDYTLTFDGGSYFDVVILDLSTGAALYEGDRLDEANDQWGLLKIFPLFSIGDEITLSASLSLPDAGSAESGSVLSCSLGPYDCAAGSTSAEYDGSKLDLIYGSIPPDQGSWFRGTLAAGGSMLFDYYPGEPTAALTESGDLALWGIWRANFTVVRDNSLPPPAPVPLPAAALMLPVGLGGLAMLKRRKRRSDKG